MRTTKTTKLLAIALSLLMLLTMIPLSVSADETTGTILDVAQNDGNGNYYLTGDVTVTATYVDEFTGTFDGKGYTVTTSVPLFTKVNGATIKNLTVEGTVTGYAAVASCVTGANKTVFENVINKADVTNTTATLTDGGFGLESTVVPAGGIVFLIYEAKCDFVGCVNEGDVTSDRLSAGIVSYVYTGEVSVSNCKNSGTITGNGNSAAGLVATSATNSTVMIENSENTGSISGAMYVGGIFGSTPTKANSNLSITKCSNSGAINSTSTRSGGIVGYLKNKDAGYNISYCYNTASVTAAAGNQECGGIVGCLADTISKVAGCYNAGTVTGNQAAQIYWNTSTDDRGLNYYLSDDSDSVLLPYYSSGSSYEGNSKSYAEGDLASGKLAYTMNTDIGQEIYFQNINTSEELKDYYPVLDPTHEHVTDVNSGDSSGGGDDDPDVGGDDTQDTDNNTQNDPDDTQNTDSDTKEATSDKKDTAAAKSEETTDEAVSGGCGSVVGGSALIVAGAVSLAGVAVTRKKKENN